MGQFIVTVSMDIALYMCLMEGTAVIASQRLQSFSKIILIETLLGLPWWSSD